MQILDNYKLNYIYNKLSKKGLCKYIGLYIDNNINCSKNKDEIIKELEELFNKEQKIYDNFIKFYLDTEEAGQKIFYFYKFEFSELVEKNIEKFLKSITDEANRKFDIKSDGEYFYKKTDNEILIKYIEVKKSYIHDRFLDKEDEHSFFKGYRIVEIPNILSFRFFLDKNKVLIGIDKHSELDSKKDIESKIDSLFEDICGENSVENLEGLIGTDIINDFLFEQNVISYKIDNEINHDKKSILYAKKGDLDKILNDISSLKYSIDEVKIYNPDYDIKTHPTYLAEQSRIFEDSSLNINIDIAEIYWFSYKYKKPDYFRIKINCTDSSLVTYSPSITNMELEDVIYKII